MTQKIQLTFILWAGVCDFKGDAPCLMLLPLRTRKDNYGIKFQETNVKTGPEKVNPFFSSRHTSDAYWSERRNTKSLFRFSVDSSCYDCGAASDVHVTATQDVNTETQRELTALHLLFYSVRYSFQLWQPALTLQTHWLNRSCLCVGVCVSMLSVFKMSSFSILSAQTAVL